MPNNSHTFNKISNALKREGLTVDSQGRVSAGPVNLSIAAQVLYDTELERIGALEFGSAFLSGALFTMTDGMLTPDNPTGSVTSSFANTFHRSLNPSGGGVDVDNLMDTGMKVSRNTPFGPYPAGSKNIIKGRTSFPQSNYLQDVANIIGPLIEEAYDGKVKVVNVTVTH